MDKSNKKALAFLYANALIFFTIWKSKKWNVFTSNNWCYLFQFFPCKFSRFHTLGKSRLTNSKLFGKFCYAHIRMNTSCFNLFLYCNKKSLLFIRFILYILYHTILKFQVSCYHLHLTGFGLSESWSGFQAAL